MPLSVFDILYLMEMGDVDKSKEIIVYGRTISSLYDQLVARKLILRGHKSVKTLQGGLSTWKKNGYPVEP
jgi:3-mercaptopyruvate sulfurtransferase SseA